MSKQAALGVRVSRLEARREAILAAATAAFLEHGFAGATLDDVIASAGGSRATVYAQFGNKEGLFAAIIAGVCDRMLAPLDAAIDAGRPLADVLRAFALRYATAFLEPGRVALFRVAAARLGDYLAGAKRRRELKVRHPAIAARIFLEMITGDLHKRALFGVPPAPSPAEIEEVVEAAVASFLSGCARP